MQMITKYNPLKSMAVAEIHQPNVKTKASPCFARHSHKRVNTVDGIFVRLNANRSRNFFSRKGISLQHENEKGNRFCTEIFMSGNVKK